VRYKDWLLVMICLSAAVIASCWAYKQGVVAGRKEVELSYLRQIKTLEQLVNHEEIKKDLAGGRK
jgi:hypothetical protein